MDLSKVTDVSDAREQTGRGNSLKLSTAQGHVCYIADSETELVEWISALEGAVARIMKAIAGQPGTLESSAVLCHACAAYASWQSVARCSRAACCQYTESMHLNQPKCS